MPGPYIGMPLKRFEDPRLLRGEGSSVDDLREPGLLHAGFVRSPHAHARIVRLDTAVAGRAPGVAGVFTGEDLRELQTPPATLAASDARGSVASPLASGEVRFVAEPVAIVIADTRYRAEDAARLIEVEYEPLPGVADATAALEPDAPAVAGDAPGNLCYRMHVVGGDVEAAFGRAAHRVAVRAQHHRIAPVALEPRGLLVRPEADGKLTVWASSQAPHRLRAGLAAGLGVAEDQIRVIAPDVGGGFGSKGGCYREDVVVAGVARRVGRPVKWVATRMEDLLTTQHARDQVDEAETAFDADGRALAMRVRTVCNVGAYLHGGNTMPATRMPSYSTGAYTIDNLDADVRTVFTHTNPTGAYRGAGRPEATYIAERTMDAAARQLGIDPIEIRRRNFIQPDQFPYTTPDRTVFDSGDLPRLLDAALEAADYPSWVRERDARRAAGELVGIGVSTFVELTGAGWESGTVQIERDGTVTAITGSSAHGQGHKTMFAQVVADQFGVAIDRVRILQSDTDLIPTAVGTFGSRSTVAGGGALVKASDEVKSQALALAAEALEASPGDLELSEGAVRVRGVAEGALSLEGLAALASVRAEEADGRLKASVTFQAPGPVISAGAYLAFVSIDRDSGRLAVERFVAVDDCGVVVNPLIVEGQVHGALAQGFGEVLWERMVYDADGQVLSGSLLDYAIPTAHGLLEWEVGRTVTPSPINPLGAKGAGEAGTIGAPPALVNAALDALAPLGVEELSLPLNDEKIWRAISTAPARLPAETASQSPGRRRDGRGSAR